MIDMNPNDVSCIYSTLKYIQGHAFRHGVTPIITFDQPLWWKAKMILVTEPLGSDLRKVVLKLGGFHTEMSFLGCVGHLMAASGLQELLELIYASNAVVYMTTGKAIARAVRGHFIVDAALNALVLASTFNVTIPEETEEFLESTENDLLKQASFLYNNLIEGSVSADKICSDNVIVNISEAIAENKEQLKHSRTAKLWLQYMDMIDILRKYIRAERMGNWELHLQTLSLFWQLLVTTITLNVRGYTYNKCHFFKKIIQKYMSILKKACMSLEEVIVTGPGSHQILL